MSNKQNVILRLTVNIDMNNQKEIAFTRAVLRRLNILFAKSRPKSGVNDILKGAKIRDAFESSTKTVTVVKQKEKSKEIVVSKLSNVHFVHKKEKKEILFVVEREIEPPENVDENTTDAILLDTAVVS